MTLSPLSRGFARSNSPNQQNIAPIPSATPVTQPTPTSTTAPQVTSPTPIEKATTKPTPAAKPKVPGLSSGPWNLPTGGFSLSLPSEWQAREKRVSHRVLEGLLSNEKGEPRQVLIVEMGVADAKTLRGYVDLFLSDGHGQLLGGPIQLDKKPAYLLKRSGPFPGMRKVWAQQQIITAAQGKQTFTIIVMADKGENIEATAKALLQGWRWQPFASPTTYLQLSPEPLRLPQTQLRLSIPRGMGVFSADETSVLLSAYDARQNLAAFTLNIASISGPKPLSLAEMRKSYGAILQQMLELPRPLTWKDSPGQPPRTMSNFFKLAVVVPDSPGTTLVSYGLVKRKENDWVLLTFNINSQELKSRALYEAAARKILDSIRDESAQAAKKDLNN